MKRLAGNSILFTFLVLLICCSNDDTVKIENPPAQDGTDFLFGADLSYVNQIQDRGGVYKENNTTADPYKIFADKGTNLARFRLWHNPLWTKEVYGTSGTQLYNDIKDVERSIAEAKANGMQVLLDLHYSDTWADPGKQHIPAAWQDITTIDVLSDSVYSYTSRTLHYLNNKGLLPEFIQLGNETNCGMLYTEAPAGFPAPNVCEGQWLKMGKVLNSGIRAVRDITETTAIKTKVILHVADPKNVDWWFTNIQDNGMVTDYDVIGFSYYPLWHTTITLNEISSKISEFKTKFSKDVMILETAYPWTTESEDSYGNLFGNTQPLSGYPFSETGQYEFLKKLTMEVKSGSGIGLIYWEPAWISSDMKDLWGTGSSWENCTFFDFDGNAIKGIDYMKFNY